MTVQTNDIRHVVVAHQRALRDCYESEAERNPHLGGVEVTVRWHIDPGGSVTESSVRESSFRNENVEGCLLREVSSWTFTATGEPTDVVYPFLFRAVAPPARRQ